MSGEKMRVFLKNGAAFMAIAAALAGCSAVDRIQNIGATPKLAPITNPQQGQVMLPMPPQPATPRQASSLWQTNAHSFFPDPRATHVGDIITVNLTNFFGLENQLASATGADPSKLVNMGSSTANTGAGSVNRSETINLTLAALVTQILPNGNMVISGHQQVKVNTEMRDLQISGVVRYEDVTQDNTINLSQIAEARISYGGQGQITDVQQPRYGSQLFDILMPF